MPSKSLFALKRWWKRSLFFPALGSALCTSFAARAETAHEPGLLFYLSGENGTRADFASNGKVEPNFVFHIDGVADGAKGAALRCQNDQRLSYWAPGNIYAQRGTLSFFWRARDAVGPTEFPIFRVGYGDHSSWDMVWLRIDYNGHGFDAFVTDINLARTRVSVSVAPFPKPTEWIHLALAWDETSGIRFYVNGKLAAEKKAAARFDAALDQFGPHSRIISPYQVQSDYNYVRGGDLDELRIYDRALADADVAHLAKGEGLPHLAPLPPRALSDRSVREEWAFRYGWNRPKELPAEIGAAPMTIRKVEIHDAYDVKRWWWKGTDGIRETTWPGVYNQSRLPGRNDYFHLPDWDCYTISGKSVTFNLPNEPWNHIEISGSAWGKGVLVGKKSGATPPSEKEEHLFDRAKGQERSVYQFADRERVGGKIRFDNVEQEQPIGEFAVYHVAPGSEPKDTASLAYTFEASSDAANDAGLRDIISEIRGRHPLDEQFLAVAHPGGYAIQSARAASTEPAAASAATAYAGLPLIHLLIPAVSPENGYNLDKIDGALDGVAVDLPAWTSSKAKRVSFNIRVKDPLWPARDMLDYTFTADVRQPHTLWLDTRDRVLPPGRPIYLTISASESPVNLMELAPREARLIFKSREAGRAEHEIDRFTQLRDSYAMLVEESPRDRRYRLWARFEDDLNDLLRVNPLHPLGLLYKADAYPQNGLPPFVQPEPPQGVPLWAFRQVEALRRAKNVALWYIDHRQIANGEMGGGLSDDTDLANSWPGLALIGEEPEKIAASDRRILDACYAHGMFTRGLPTIQTDELHSYEEGINALGQMLLLDYGSPRQIERAMETARGIESITGVNRAGHRHIRSSYYSGSRVAEEGVWGWAKAYSYLVLQPVLELADFNGDPGARKLALEITDGLLAHRKLGADGKYYIPGAIEFATDAEGKASRRYSPWALFWAAWKWTGDKKYLAPIFDEGSAGIAGVNENLLDLLNLRETAGKTIVSSVDLNAKDTSRPDNVAEPGLHLAWQMTGDKRYLEKLYATLIERAADRDYINTEGSLWIDRVYIYTNELQRARLGGIALNRNAIFPGHVVSWRFDAPATGESVAVLIPHSTETEFDVIAYNLEKKPVKASITGWNVAPGEWQIEQGVDQDGNDKLDTAPAVRTVDWGRSQTVNVTFPPRTSTLLHFKNVKLGTPYAQRPDLGFDPEDITRRAGKLEVRIHNVGSIAAPESKLVLLDSAGKVVSAVSIPSIQPPKNWRPSTILLELKIPEDLSLDGTRVVIDPDNALEEITKRNNAVELK
ncbi:MAG TPA: LamG-like jellyroll fold domain-containing protein [Opitutaceae bacterium]|nr:LamG-like jellyroll fold domain-containing protein [Opitutaceae bacterium]